MSRIGNSPITVPADVEVKINGQNISVKGPKGTLEREIHNNMKVSMDNGVITVVRPDDEPENRSLHGLTRTLINNMIHGVKEEYQRELQINGVGYRAQKQGTKLVMNLGYSHPVEMEAPAGITFDVPNPNTIIVKGIDKELVGQTAAVIRTKRPPEVYRGKVLNMLKKLFVVKREKLAKNKNSNEKRHLALSSCIKIFSMYRRTISKIFNCFPSNIPLLLWILDFKF